MWGWTQGLVSSSWEWMSHGRLLVLPGVNLPLNSLQASLSPHWWNAYFKYCLWRKAFSGSVSEKAMATHSSTLAWQIPWMEGPGGLQSMGSLGVGHDWATSLYFFTFMHWRRNVNPLQCSCLENPRDRGAWWAAVYGVAQSQTRLKQLSSSSTHGI